MWSLFFVPWRKLGLLTSKINSVERPGFSRQIDVIHEVDHKLVIMDSKSSGAVLNSNQVWNNIARQTRMTHLKWIMDALEGEIGEPRLHVVDPSPWLSSPLLGFEYGLGALDKQVGRVFALDLWPWGEIAVMQAPLSLWRDTSQNMLVESEVIPAILGVLVIVLRQWLR